MSVTNEMSQYENSPPPEGGPQGGVVGRTAMQNETFDRKVLQDMMVNSSQHKESTTKQLYINNIPIQLQPLLVLPYNIKLKQRAKDLRQAENLPEVLFWMQVTKGRFHRIDFDRQRIIGNYIVDFYVKRLGLVIEIDGSSHQGKEDYDKEREAYLISFGLRVYRIKVVDVLQHMSQVMAALEEYIVQQYGVVG